MSQNVAFGQKPDNINGIRKEIDKEFFDDGCKKVSTRPDYV